MKKSKRYYKVKVRFIVKKEEGVVVAVAHDCGEIAIEEIFNKCDHAHVIAFSFGSYRDYRINDTYRAVARCSADDEWDEEIGKKIALKRLQAKLDRVVARKLIRFADDMQELADEARERAANYNNLVSEFEADPLC